MQATNRVGLWGIVRDMEYDTNKRYTGRQSGLDVNFFSVRPKNGTFPVDVYGDVWDAPLQVVVNGVRREKS